MSHGNAVLRIGRVRSRDGSGPDVARCRSTSANERKTEVQRGSRLLVIDRRPIHDRRRAVVNSRLTIIIVIAMRLPPPLLLTGTFVSGLVPPPIAIAVV